MGAAGRTGIGTPIKGLMQKDWRSGGKNRRMPVFLRQSFFAAISNPHHGLQSLCREDCSLCPWKTAVPAPGRPQSLPQEDRSPCPGKIAVPVPGTVSALSKPGPVQFPGNPRAFLQLFQTVKSVHDGFARYHRPVVFKQVSVAVTNPFPEC